MDEIQNPVECMKYSLTKIKNIEESQGSNGIIK